MAQVLARTHRSHPRLHRRAEGLYRDYARRGRDGTAPSRDEQGVGAALTDATPTTPPGRGGRGGGGGGARFAQDRARWVAFERSCAVTAVDAADTLPCGVGVARDARLLRVCSAGEGVDRHLMGLRLVSEAGDEHPFWTDVAVSRSTHWTLSTSNMTPCT